MMASARFANPDALLHLFIVLTMFCFWQSQRQKGTQLFSRTKRAASPFDRSFERFGGPGQRTHRPDSAGFWP